MQFLSPIKQVLQDKHEKLGNQFVSMTLRSQNLSIICRFMVQNDI